MKDCPGLALIGMVFSLLLGALLGFWAGEPSGRSKNPAATSAEAQLECGFGPGESNFIDQCTCGDKCHCEECGFSNCKSASAKCSPTSEAASTTPADYHHAFECPHCYFKTFVTIPYGVPCNQAVREFYAARPTCSACGNSMMHTYTPGYVPGRDEE